jgi:hypothetical protein
MSMSVLSLGPDLLAIRRAARWRAAALAVGVASLLVAGPAAAGEASGAITFPKAGKATLTATLKHAYLLKGPDLFDPARVVRRLYLTSTDIGAALKGCSSFSCASGHVTEGMTLDLDSDRRFGFWVVLKNGMVQHSDTAEKDALDAAVNSPERVKGRFRVDYTQGGGPKVDVEFDASLLAEMKAAM